jgi:hypothetical protein
VGDSALAGIPLLRLTISCQEGVGWPGVKDLYVCIERVEILCARYVVVKEYQHQPCKIMW